MRKNKGLGGRRERDNRWERELEERIEREEKLRGKLGKEGGREQQPHQMSLMLAAARRAFPSSPSMADCSICATQYFVLDVLLSHSTASRM